MNRVTAQEARSLLAYDEATGLLTWKARPRHMFTTAQSCSTWNTRYAGKAAGCASSSTGYLVMSIHDRRELVHRVIWLIVTGEWPSEQIDHQDHCRTNNRWTNLRQVSHAENGRNQRLRRTNKSGAHGVRQRSDTGKWTARIRIDGKTKNLGCFDTDLEAAAARRAAETEAAFHPSHGTSS